MGDGRHVVVRNTFLEFSDDTPGEETRRTRAFSDMTDSKLPIKVELSNRAGFYEVSRHRIGSTLEGGPAPPPGTTLSGAVSGTAAGLAGDNAGLGLPPVFEDDAKAAAFAHLGAGLSAGGIFPPMHPMGPPGDLGWMPPLGPDAAPPYPTNPMWWAGYGGPPMPPPPFSPNMMPFSGYGEPPRWPGYGLPQHSPTMEKAGRRGGGQKNSLQLSEHLNEAGGGKGQKSKGKAQAQPFSGAPAATPAPASTCPPGQESTVMLRNVPNSYSRAMLLQLLNMQGFESRYDFVYLPMDFRNGVNLGYAFVNLVAHQDAVEFTQALQGFSNWSSDSAKICEVSWAHPHQGYEEHVERYRNSPVMHPTMPPEYMPMVFRNGLQQPFPAPTKAIKAPKLRLTTRDGPRAGQEE